MKNMTLKNIATAAGGVLYADSASAETDVEKTEASGVVIDSRKIEKGFVFIATRGERVDGHSFIDSAFEKGAIGVVCEKAPANPKGAYILVKDSFQALKDIAEFYRRQLDIKVVGITGSVGKTSTKEFIAGVLAKGFNTLKTEGNFNNEIGLPLTVLRIKEDCEAAVLEMGISDFGEMTRLSKIAKPDICVITNIGQCHLENLGTRDGILKAKTEIFEFMDKDGSVCLNGDDDKLATIKEVNGKRPLFFGMGRQNDIYADNYENKGLDGSSARIHIKSGGAETAFDAQIPLLGEHMVYNALAAAAVGVLLGLSPEQISEGISSVKPVGGRSHVIRTDSYTIIDDCYNANPVSMRAALDLLSQSSDARKVAILGDMFELGENENALHAQTGEYAADGRTDVLICVGKLCKNMYDAAQNMENSAIELHYFEDKAQMLSALDGLLKNGDTVLVKASHGMGFDEVVKKLSE